MLRPWENGTIAERKIFPINIISATSEPEPAIVPINLETAAERKTIPINVASAAATLKQANVQSNRVNAEPINISKNDFQNVFCNGGPFTGRHSGTWAERYCDLRGNLIAASGLS